MKRSKIIVLFLALCLAFSACKGGDSGATTASSDSVPGTSVSALSPSTSSSEINGSEESLSESFVTFWNNGTDSFTTPDYQIYKNNHGRLQIFDAKNKKDLVYCFDPGCEHDKITKRDWRTGEVLDQGCIAYEISSSRVMLQGENLYFLKDHDVCVSDRQGLNQRVIGNIPSYILGYDTFFMKDKIFVNYGNNYEMIEVPRDNGEVEWIVGEQKAKTTQAILCFDLNEKTWKEVFQAEDYNAYLSQCVVRGEHLYFAYWYCEIPGMDMFGNTYGAEIPEGCKDLTPDEYREEVRKRRYLDIYDYNATTGERTKCLDHVHLDDGGVVFGKDFFALSERSKEGIDLYNYTGECYLQLERSIYLDVWTDSHLLISTVEDKDHYILIDEKTGNVLKKTQNPLPNETFHPLILIGDSCYCNVFMNGFWGKGYLPAEDFWNGDLTNIVQFMYDYKPEEIGQVILTTEPASSEPTPTESSTETEPTTDEVVPTTEDPEEALLPRITVGLHFGNFISVENQDEINRLLKEKGMDFRLDFSFSTADFEDYPKWVQEQKENGTLPDIVATSVGANSIFDIVDFVENDLVSLNDFLSTEEGKKLRDAYSDLEWKGAEIDGKIQTVPSRKNKLFDIHVYVNENYKNVFDTMFDGSYDSLRAIRSNASDPDPVIVISNLERYIVWALMGELEFNFTSFDIQAGEFVDLFSRMETKEFFEHFYEDYKDGSLIAVNDPNELPDNTLVYITLSSAGPLPGFLDITWHSAFYRSKFTTSWGVSATSQNVDLALHALAVCFSDPDIAPLFVSYGWEGGRESNCLEMPVNYN